MSGDVPVGPRVAPLARVALWPSGTARPNVSTINFTQNDPSLANGAIVGLGPAPNDLSAYNSAGNVNVIIDITGYFQ